MWRGVLILCDIVWYIPCYIELWYHMVYTTIGIYHHLYIPWYITDIIPVYTIPYYMVYTMLYSMHVLPHHMWYTMWYHTSDAFISHGISHLFEPISQPISQRWYIPTSMVYTMWYHMTQPSRWHGLRVRVNGLNDPSSFHLCMICVCSVTLQLEVCFLLRQFKSVRVTSSLASSSLEPPATGDLHLEPWYPMISYMI